jgi:hypothetical protein
MAGELIGVRCQQAGLAVHYGIAHTADVEAHCRCAPNSSLGNDQPPSLKCRRMKQSPRLAQQTVLLFLIDVADVFDVASRKSFEMVALGAVADDDELPAGQRAH